MRRPGENPLALGAALVGRKPGPVERDVAGRLRPQQRGVGLDCRGDVGHRVARRVIDRDEFGRVACRRFGFGNHHRDRVADMPDDVAGQRRPVRHDEPIAVRHRRGNRYISDAFAFEVGGGEDGENGGLSRCLARVDAADGREGMGRAHEHRMRRAGGALIVGEAARARQQPRVFVTRLERKGSSRIHCSHLQIAAEHSSGALSLNRACRCCSNARVTRSARPQARWRGKPGCCHSRAEAPRLHVSRRRASHSAHARIARPADQRDRSRHAARRLLCRRQVGITISFGMLDIVNIAHPAFIMLARTSPTS